MMNTRCAAPFHALKAFGGSGGRVGATAMNPPARAKGKLADEHVSRAIAAAKPAFDCEDRYEEDRSNHSRDCGKLTTIFHVSESGLCILRSSENTSHPERLASRNHATKTNDVGRGEVAKLCEDANAYSGQDERSFRRL
jgi:hypothetical protein